MPVPPAVIASADPAGQGGGVAAAAGAISDRGVAERLIAAGQFAEARAILERLEEETPRDNQVQFLLALLDRQELNYDAAIRRFRRILVDEPEAERVRLELGRTFFESGDYPDAERQFRLARAAVLPAGVIENIDRYLGAIRQRKTFSVDISLAVSSDSNLNAGPATDTITLYGLPFQLSEDAQATSGIGIVGDVRAEWVPRIAKKAKLLVGTLVHRAQYGQASFNDTTALVYAGPRINLRSWEFNLRGMAARRWYGDKAYSHQIGGSFDATYFVNARLGLSGALAFNYTDYDRNPLQSGTGGAFSLSAFYAPTSASFLRGTVQVGRQDAKVGGYANWSRLAGVQYSRDFKGGFTLGLMPSVTQITYDAPLAAFPERRKDTQLSSQISILNRRIDIYGLTPKLVYTYTNNHSSIDLYSFSRSKFELAISSSF